VTLAGGKLQEPRAQLTCGVIAGSNILGIRSLASNFDHAKRRAEPEVAGNLVQGIAPYWF